MRLRTLALLALVAPLPAALAGSGDPGAEREDGECSYAAPWDEGGLYVATSGACASVRVERGGEGPRVRGRSDARSLRGEERAWEFRFWLEGRGGVLLAAGLTWGLLDGPACGVASLDCGSGVHGARFGAVEDWERACGRERLFDARRVVVRDTGDVCLARGDG